MRLGGILIRSGAQRRHGRSQGGDRRRSRFYQTESPEINVDWKKSVESADARTLILESARHKKLFLALQEI
jgi:hypothetical protein